MEFKPNPNKNLVVVVDGDKYARYPVRTKLITPADTNIGAVVAPYIQDVISDDDIVFISEKMIAIMQGRAYPITAIKPSWWAKKLSRLVTKNPAGIGLSIPETMQLAIDEVGLLRILIAAGFSAITKLFGLKGVFYYIAGRQAAGIDGPVDYAIPPYNQYASKGPIHPEQVVRELERLPLAAKVRFAIVDANDLGVDVLGASEGINKKLLKKIIRDNPLGQCDESTPIGIIRRIIN